MDKTYYYVNLITLMLSDGDSYIVFQNSYKKCTIAIYRPLNLKIKCKFKYAPKTEGY